MKISPMLIVAMLAALLLGGCGSNSTPYNALDTTVNLDTKAVQVATVAVQDGAPASPYANDLLTGEEIFQQTLPTLESLAVSTAAPTLAAGAVTKSQLDSDITALNGAILGLHTAINGSLTAAIEVQHRAALAAKAKK